MRVVAAQLLADDIAQIFAVEILGAALAADAEELVLQRPDFLDAIADEARVIDATVVFLTMAGVTTIAAVAIEVGLAATFVGTFEVALARTVGRQAPMIEALKRFAATVTLNVYHFDHRF